MNIKKGSLIIVGALILIFLGLLVKNFITQKVQQQVATGEPLDVVSDFYLPWLDAVQSTSTDPYTEGMSENPILGKELRAHIKDSKPQKEGDIDPVLCQTVIPEKIATRAVYQSDEKAQFVITGRKTESTLQSVVTLNQYNGGWYIDQIECTLGEVPPEREFTFERKGSLIKDSIMKPFDSQYWHLVFEENDEQGHVAPLFFSPESMCLSKDGNTSVCDTSQFKEAMHIFVQGEMSERGVDVKKAEITE